METIFRSCVLPVRPMRDRRETLDSDFQKEVLVLPAGSLATSPRGGLAAPCSRALGTGNMLCMSDLLRFYQTSRWSTSKWTLCVYPNPSPAEAFECRGLVAEWVACRIHCLVQGCVQRQVTRLGYCLGASLNFVVSDLSCSSFSTLPIMFAQIHVSVVMI